MSECWGGPSSILPVNHNQCKVCVSRGQPIANEYIPTYVFIAIALHVGLPRHTISLNPAVQHKIFGTNVEERSTWCEQEDVEYSKMKHPNLYIFVTLPIDIRMIHYITLILLYFIIIYLQLYVFFLTKSYLTKY